MSIFVSPTQFGISLESSAKILFEKCYFNLSRSFMITRESKDEQRPVLVSAQRPPKITLHENLNS